MLTETTVRGLRIGETCAALLKPQVKTPEEKTAAALKWESENPEKARAVIEELRRYVSEAPIHSSLLGPVAERYGIPKPISAFIRLHDNFRILAASASPVNSPALCLASKTNDSEYWAKFRRKALDGNTPVINFNPWIVLGHKDPNKPFGPDRIAIFEAFFCSAYGVGRMKDMAAVCAAFKRASGVSFQGFFGGLRPAEFAKLSVAKNHFTWSWSSDEPPCLYCAVKKSSYPAFDGVTVDPKLVSSLIPVVAKNLPEEIDFSALALRHKMTDMGVMVCYLAALREALKMATSNSTTAKPTSAIDREQLKQIYLEAKSAAAEISAVVAKLERLFPDIVK